MRLHKIFIFIVFALFQTMFYPLSAQVAPPVIENIDKTSGTVSEIVTITGSGFGSDPAKISIFFGAAMADSIISITDTRIRVAVPAGATSSSIAVTNLNSHLTAYSSKHFTLSYDGKDFDMNMDGLGGDYQFPTSGTNIYNLCFCDFNLDGLNDIATTDTESRTVTILQNASPDVNSVNFTQKQISIAAKTRWVRCGDLNGDGLPDLVFSASNTNTSTEKVYIFKNISASGGDITFEIPSPPLSYPIDGNLAARMEIKDMDGDGLPEIIATDLSSVGGVSVFRNQSTPGGAINFFAAPVTPFPTFNIPAVELGSVDVEDLNGDGLPELIVAKEDQNNVYVFTNTSTPGNINFSSYIILRSFTQASNMNMKVSDINGDHKPDVIIINNYYVGIYKNTTQSGEQITFDEQIRFDQTQLIRESLDIADMDGNRKLDIVVGSTTNQIVVLLNNSTEGNIDFSTQYQKNLFTNEKNNSVRAGDLNGDGKPDLAYTGRTTNVISILLNRNCIKPVLGPQGGLNVCDTLPYQLTVTKAIGVDYTWESSEDGISFTPITDAADSTSSFTTSNEAFYRVKVSSLHNGFPCSEISNVVEVRRPDGFVPKKPVIINPNPQAPYCFGETVIIKTEYINAEFVWIDPDNNIIPDATTNMLVLENVTAADAGEYQVFVKASSEQGGCQSEIATTTISVSEPKAISIQRNKLPVFFQGGQVILSVEDIAESTYSWKRNGQVISNANSPELIATAAGDYVATIKNSLGCTRESAPFTVALAHANVPEKICINEAVEFTVTPASLAGQDIRYRWDLGNGESKEGTTINYQYKTAGNYTVAVEVLSADESIADRYEKLVTVPELPDLKIATTNYSVYLCPGESIKLTANEGFSAYNWNTGATSGTITVREAGIYTLTATANSGCTVSRSVEVKDAEVPEITISARTDHIYLGDTIRLTATPGETEATYLWSPRSTLDDNTSMTPVARPLTTTTYTCTVISKDGCQTTAEFTIAVTRALDVTAQKVFTPNNDGRHDTWHIERMDLYPDCHMAVFNRQGIKVYEAENYSNQHGWDGTIRGIPAPAGVYFYLINCGEEAGSQAGSVTIVR